MSENDHYKFGLASGRKIDPSIPMLRGKIRILEGLLKEAHDELTNHGHQELPDCDCKIARELCFERNTSVEDK
jgi:hypothetical protein